ncbi:MAG: GTPase Era [Spirochaetales bacterium]|jgi:GTPase|nr:GTPase Era [Spirochaetales bacterium]
MKSAFISIIGRPSSGKSTLLNALCGYKVSIVAPTPQTTLNRIRGIVNSPYGQLVFIDTPGFHTSEKTFNHHLKDLVMSSLDEVDLLLYVLDVSRPPGAEENALLDLTTAHGNRVIAALNKIDLDSKGADERRFYLSGKIDSERIFPVSALDGSGLDELKAGLFSFAPEGEPMYPDDMYTDQTQEFRIAEIIREKAVNKVRQELPHAVFVSIADLEIAEEKNKLWIRAFLNVERESQKGIVIGKGGEIIRAIRQESQKELKRIFSYSIELDLRVKVVSDWRKREALLKKLIY